MSKFTDLKGHPIADILPRLSGDEAASLRDDIHANGLIDQIVLLDGKILDGRNRYAALVELDMHRQENFYVEFEHVVKAAGSTAVPMDFVIAKNVERRHLTDSQRAMVAADFANMRQGERTDLVKPVDVGKPDGDKAIENGGEKGELDNTEPSANLPLVSQGDAAKRLHVSERSVRSAVKVNERGTAALGQLVRDGKVAVSVAADIAELTKPEQDKIIAETPPARMKTIAKQTKRNARQKQLARKQMALPVKKYGVIYADCEHLFKTRSEAGNDRGAANHYDVSTLAELQVRRVVDIAADDCVLFFWVPVPNLIEGICIAQAWGFLELVKDDKTGFFKPIKKFSRYVSQWSWLKEKITTGFWSRGKHEMLLIFTRGRPVAPAEGQQPPSWLEAAETLSTQGKHSEKPDLFAAAIAALFPDTPKIELNARKAREGWDRWGHEAPVPGAEQSDKDKADDLMLIKGLGPKAVEKLNDCGIHTFADMVEKGPEVVTNWFYTSWIAEAKNLAAMPDTAPAGPVAHESVTAMARKQRPATPVKAMAKYEGKHTDATDAVIIAGDKERKSLIEVCALLGLADDQVRVVKRRRKVLGLTSADNTARANKARSDAAAKARSAK